MAEYPYTNIAEYIAQCPAEKQPRLRELQRVIAEEAPEAKEKISWGMPTFHLGENLIHFADAKKHIGLYPGSEAIVSFSKAFDEMGLRYTVGGVQLPDHQPLPLDLVRDIVRYRVKLLADKK